MTPSDSEEESVTDSDDESLPESEGGSSVAPADKVCVELSCLYRLSSCCINAFSCIYLHTNNMFDVFQHIDAVSVHLEQLMRHTQHLSRMICAACAASLNRLV